MFSVTIILVEFKLNRSAFKSDQAIRKIYYKCQIYPSLERSTIKIFDLE